ncbi:MBL fold metallo-hydrolase [Alkalicoccus daliensis]|uniref:L-ascorbate metabolism protein UlaG, beta-lactamase superfamily n=1 Tax=Alkalicoccus daliensis TaxID=745820 RepID=A0A1H0HFU1_9BACI|nr:MBL fold metallo-hydrolase [Alkalicoccus daliensis]SDO17923.1 L-ascorbate metabolism protein UlaG, beta-lactamase superfamily [Alkalicoccus daliensis]
MLKTIFKLSAVAAAAAALFVNVHPGFGKGPDKKERNTFRSLPNIQKGRFVNEKTSNMEMNAADLYSFLKDSLQKREERSPAGDLLLAYTDWKRENSITWFGHSTFYITIGDFKILVDPMLGPAASPVSFLGSRRYTGSLLHLIEEMPEIDVVLLTHDHYDHLDYPSIQKLHSKVRRFLVPLGVGAHLKRWGVEAEKITELNWWEETKEEGILFALTPSRHFSGRGMLNRDHTLWGGWAVLAENTRLYISGDGGYGPHFKKIGAAYGPFDLTMMEGGQYDDRWNWVHMRPEEAVQGHKDVHGRKMMLAHWGGFTLAYHSRKEPVERALKAAEAQEVELLTPAVGSTVSIHEPAPQPKWWR